MSLNEILMELRKTLIGRQKAKEKVLDMSRKITWYSKQAIMAIHRGELGRAKRRLGLAQKIIDRIESVCAGHPDLKYTGGLFSAYQEYVEAHVFLKLVKEGKFPNPKELGIPSTSFVLGLADVVGEFRRRVLDSLRSGDLGGAEECLNIMEEIYTELTRVENSYLLASNLRRKCDVARHLIEVTRGDITFEVRRSQLEKSIKLLEKTIRELKEAESKTKGYHKPR